MHTEVLNFGDSVLRLAGRSEIGYGNIGAPRGQGEGNCASNAARGSGDQRHLAVQIPIRGALVFGNGHEQGLYSGPDSSRHRRGHPNDHLEAIRYSVTFRNMGMKIYRVVRWMMLAGLIISIVLMLKSPAPIAPQVDPATAKLNADSFQEKLGELQSAQESGATGTEVHFTAPEVNAALVTGNSAQEAGTPAGANAPTDAPATVKSAQVTFDGDQVKGQFLTVVYGREVYVTIAGRLGSKDGYVTFAPTAFKIGDLSVPVGMVDPALQKKLADPDQHEKLKLPTFVKDLRVKQGELVMTQ